MFQLENQITPVAKMAQKVLIYLLFYMSGTKITNSFCYYEISTSG